MKKTTCKTAVSPKPKSVKSQATPPLRAAIYCRAQDAEAIEAQKTCLTKMIKSNPGWTPAGVFADIGPASSERPEFHQMLQKYRQNEIGLILTKSVSRFARSLMDYLRIIKILQKLDVAVIFEKENINTMEPDSSMSITMMGAFAQAESESMSGNVTWGKRQAMRKGKVVMQYKHLYAYERGEDGKPRIIPEQTRRWCGRSTRYSSPAIVSA